MATRREALPEAPFDFAEAYAELAEQMRSVHISRISEMPRVGLYLDQVLSIVSMELAFMYAPDEKIVTGSMVNNYVKQKIVPAPNHKRYTRRHLASLLYVCSFKRVFSIAQIKQEFDVALEEDIDVEKAYDQVLTAFESELTALFPEDPGAKPVFEPVEIQLVNSGGLRCAPELERFLENAVLMLACKVYADHIVALEAQRTIAPEP